MTRPLAVALLAPLAAAGILACSAHGDVEADVRISGFPDAIAFIPGACGEGGLSLPFDAAALSKYLVEIDASRGD